MITLNKNMISESSLSTISANSEVVSKLTLTKSEI